MANLTAGKKEHHHHPYNMAAVLSFKAMNSNLYSKRFLKRNYLNTLKIDNNIIDRSAEISHLACCNDFLLQSRHQCY